MIERLRKINDQLYRGSAPSPTDVKYLKNHFKINKIISLDQLSGDHINSICKQLHIKHLILPLDHTKESLIKFFHHDLKKIFLSGGPVYIHCSAGKDRTGFVCALLECKYLGQKPHEALKQALDLGFGVDVNPNFKHMIELFKKIILNCKSQDENKADIVSNQREYISDNRTSPLDEAHQGSFAPLLSVTRQYPYDPVYNQINDQSLSRENYKSDSLNSDNPKNEKEKDIIPQVGLYNNDAGVSRIWSYR